MNLYIFNETRRGAVFGVGTYIRELTFALQNRSLHICIINLLSDKPYIHSQYLQPIITQYFIDNKSEIWLLFLIAHSKR